MKPGHLWKGTQLLGLVIAGGMLAGCQTTEPVREYNADLGASYADQVVAAVAEVQNETPCVAPVGEQLIIRSPGDRYFNPLTRSWERPYPYGPYDTANWR